MGKIRMKLTLDANIFLNVIFEEKQFLESSTKLLKLIEQKKFEACISSITLSEIIWIVYKNSGYRKAKEVSSYMKELSELGLIKIVSLDEEIVFRMLELIERYKLSLVDSLVLSTAIDASADALVTRDESFKKIKEIKIKIPDEMV